MKTKVQVKDLRIGDELSMGTKVIEAPVPLPHNSFLGKDKAAVGVEYANGKRDQRVWGKNTTLTVINR